MMTSAPSGERQHAEAFLDILQRVKFRGRVHVEGLEWLFQLPATLPFLQYLCDEVHQDTMLLSTEELSLYHDLEEQDKVLHGAELEEAVERLRVFESEETLESLEQELRELDAALLKHQGRLRRCVSQRDVLCSTHDKVLGESSAILEVEEASERELRELEHDVGRLGEELDSALDSLAATADSLVRELCPLSEHRGASSVPERKQPLSVSQSEKRPLRQQLSIVVEDENGNRNHAPHSHGPGPQQEHLDKDKENCAPPSRRRESGSASKPVARRAATTSKAGSGSGFGSLLSQLDMSPYLESDDRFTRELNRYFVKQFHQGITSLVASTHDTSRYGLIDLNKPESLLIKGESSQTYAKHCRELSRLQMVYASSEKKHLDAQVQLARAKSVFEEASSQLLRESQYRMMDAAVVNARRVQTDEKLQKAAEETTAYEQHELPALYKELAELQVTGILRGDYDLKIARQDYFLSKQQVVIDCLREQQRRHQLVCLAFEQEKQHHQTAHLLLSALSKDLTGMGQAHTAQLAEWQERAEQTNRAAFLVRKTVDHRDRLMCRILDFVKAPERARDGESQEPEQGHGPASGASFTTYSEVASVARKAPERAQALERQNAILSDQLERAVGELFTHAQRLKQVPISSAAPVCEALRQGRESMDEFSVTLDRVVRSFDAKKKSLERHPRDSEVERDMFVQFHLRPSELKRNMAALDKRLRAHSIVHEHA